MQPRVASIGPLVETHCLFSPGDEGQEVAQLLDESLFSRYIHIYVYAQKFNYDLPRDPTITFMAQMCVANTFEEFDGTSDYRNLVLRTRGLQSCKCRTSWKLPNVQSSN